MVLVLGDVLKNRLEHRVLGKVLESLHLLQGKDGDLLFTRRSCTGGESTVAALEQKLEVLRDLLDTSQLDLRQENCKHDVVTVK